MFRQEKGFHSTFALLVEYIPDISSSILPSRPRPRDTMPRLWSVEMVVRLILQDWQSVRLVRPGSWKLTVPHFTNLAGDAVYCNVPECFVIIYATNLDWTSMLGYCGLYDPLCVLHYLNTNQLAINQMALTREFLLIDHWKYGFCDGVISKEYFIGGVMGLLYWVRLCGCRDWTNNKLSSQ